MNEAEETILSEFDALTPLLNIWGSAVDSTIKEVLNEKYIRTHLVKIPPQFRIKDRKTYLAKALYRGKQYKNPIVDIEDKIGTRIVLLKSDDIKGVAKQLRAYKSWTCKITKDIEEEIDEKPKYFDYQSMHLVVTPKISSSFPSNDIQKLTCEIQIRTLLQHAFAEVSHDSTYKGPYENDKEIVRHLAKSMALMEATDDYFCEVFEIMSDQKRYFASYVRELELMYRKINSTYDKTQLDLPLADKILGLLEQKPVLIADVKTFFNKKRTELSDIYQGGFGFIFEQPVSILISYFLTNHRSILIEHWPLSKDALSVIFRAHNLSTSL